VFHRDKKFIEEYQKVLNKQTNIMLDRSKNFFQNNISRDEVNTPLSFWASKDSPGVIPSAPFV